MSQEKDAVSQEHLDTVARLITKAAALSEVETNKIAAGPLLFARIRQRIANEQQMVNSRSPWTGFWPISKRAIPAMMIVAALSFGLSAVMTRNKTQPTAFSVDAYLGTNETGIENMVFAERRPLTREEVLATIITRDEREAGR
jgi:hypothetical protein